MNRDFVLNNSFAEFFSERVKQRNIEIEKIAHILEFSLCVIDESDYEELLLNIARVMYFKGCRVIKE